MSPFIVGPDYETRKALILSELNDTIGFFPILSIDGYALGAKYEYLENGYSGVIFHINMNIVLTTPPIFHIYMNNHSVQILDGVVERASTNEKHFRTYIDPFPIKKGDTIQIGLRVNPPNTPILHAYSRLTFYNARSFYF